MASHLLGAYYAPSSSVYFRIRNSSGLWLDFADSTFKAWASATTPYIAATASALSGGTNEFFYQATIDLDDLNSGPDSESFVVEACESASPALTDDPIAEAHEIAVQAGGLIGGDEILAMFDGAFTTTAGTTFRGVAWLEVNGQRSVLSAGSCTVTVREQGAGADLFSMTAAAVNAAGRFDLSQTSPGFNDDRVYVAEVAITTGSKTYTTAHSLQIQAT